MKFNTYAPSLLALALFSVLCTPTAHAFPLPKPGMKAEMLPKNFTANYNFEGIVALDDCSGSIIRFENSKDSDLAMVMTNGHCNEYGFPQPGQVMYGRPSTRTFAILDLQGRSIAQTEARTIIYSTMTKTDITLYQLGETYADIYAKAHVRPLTLAHLHPNLNDPVEVISGYWKRGYTCSIESFVNQLREDRYTCEDSIRYSEPGCETIGGTSGSPIVLAGTRTAIGINNTGNEDGDKCTMDNPCEIDKSGNITYKQGWSYGQETFWIYSCLNANNEVDLSTPGCLLPH